MAARGVRVAALDELPDGQPVGVQMGEERVLLVRNGDRVYACGGRCTHYGAPLEQGTLEGQTIRCPWHDARFDVTSGHMVSPPAFRDLPKYNVRIEKGEVFVAANEHSGFPAPQEGDERTFLIVGGGAAGHAAAETLRREAFGGRIVLLSGDAAQPYDRPSLSSGRHGPFRSGHAGPCSAEGGRVGFTGAV